MILNELNARGTETDKFLAEAIGRGGGGIRKGAATLYSPCHSIRYVAFAAYRIRMYACVPDDRYVCVGGGGHVVMYCNSILPSYAQGRWRAHCRQLKQ